MNKALSPAALASLAALVALGACHNKPQTIVAGNDDPQAAQLKDAKPVAPPPMIQSSRTYRCADGSVLYADFYTNNTAGIRTQKEATPTILTAEGGKPPYKATGYSLSGNGTKVMFDTPSKKSQTCDA